MGIQADDALIQRILELIGPPVPYFIHLFFSQLGQLPADQRRALTTKHLEEVYERRILGPTCKHYFDHYRQRLARYEKSLEQAAVTLLRSVAEASRGRVPASVLYDVYRKARKRGATETEFDELLADLECDWYLVLDVHTNEYSFMLHVMRDWWKRWYGSPRRAPKPGKEG